MKLAFLLMMAAVACTKKADECNSNTDCTDPMYPFCDVNGEYPPSDGAKNICTIRPTGCPVEQCGCDPGATACSDNELAVCNSDGATQTTSSCTLGCEDTGSACKSLVASNGLGSALDLAGGLPPIDLAQGTKVDTDTGVVLGPDGAQVDVTSILVDQSPAPIRAFVAGSFVIGGITVVGTNPIAFVASGKIAINGDVDAGGHGPAGGPGSINVGACVGASSSPVDGIGSGAGGGGNATMGASGGYFEVAGEPGGAAELGFTPLVGGCSGGTVLPELGGGGGGAAQIVSATDVTIVGVINVGGGGGQRYSGGGAAGVVVIESPTIEIDNTGGVAANGGGGGGGGAGTTCPLSIDGSDGGYGNTPAEGGFGCGGSTSQILGGSGATGMSAPMAGDIDTKSSMPSETYAGGGGAAGRAIFTTTSGSVSTDSNSILSALVSMSMLVTQ